MNTLLRLSLLPTLAFTLVSAIDRGTAAPAIDPRITKLFGKSADYVSQADVVSAYRVSYDKPTNDNQIDGYTILSGPEIVETKLMNRLQALLLDPECYDWNRHNLCKFYPGVALRFDRKSNRGGALPVDVIFCFRCNDMKICRGGKQIGMVNIMGHAYLFIALMKQIFPRDAEFQKL